MKKLSIDKFPHKSFLLFEPESTADLKKYHFLRWEILRKPWNQPEDMDWFEKEKGSHHIMVIDENEKAVGVCRFLVRLPGTGQVRSMAVHPDYRGTNIGSELLNYCNQLAIQSGLNQIVLDARVNAIPFYERNGYHIIEKSYLLFDDIQHYFMQKDLH